MGLLQPSLAVSKETSLSARWVRTLYGDVYVLPRWRWHLCAKKGSDAP